MNKSGKRLKVIRLKKVDGYTAEIMKEMIREGESVFEIDGKRYSLYVIEKPETTVEEDVEADPTLKQKILQAKDDISKGKVFSTDDMIEMIVDHGDDSYGSISFSDK